MDGRFSGLNLTEASLAAILKYPWMRDKSDIKGTRKWGAYPSEEEDFRFALALAPGDPLPPPGHEQTLEAAIMDWADDITYAVHDVEDLWRAGLVPADRLRASDDLRNEFAEWVFRRWQEEGRPSERRLIDMALRLFPTFFGSLDPYLGRRDQRIAVRHFVAVLVGRYVKATSLKTTNGVAVIDVDPSARREVETLKQLVWRYVIERPALASQQHGQKEMIGRIFSIYCDAADDADLRVDRALLPTALAEGLAGLNTSGTSSPATRARLVVDTICSMTEQETVSIYHRLTGVSLGSVSRTL